MSTLFGFEEVGDNYPAVVGTFGRGYQSRDYGAFPLCGLPSAQPLGIPRMSRAERIERIKEKTAKKTWVTDRCDQLGLVAKDQSNSNYCWGHAPIKGIEIRRIMQGDSLLVLSAFWLCSYIKRGRNNGGSGIEALQYLNDVGVPREDLWPPMKFRGAWEEQPLKTNAAKHLVPLFWDIDPSDKEAIETAVIADFPVTVGVPAWGHEVLLTFLRYDDQRDKISMGFDNSWGASWGTNGRGILSGAKERLDEAGAVVTVGASVD